MISYQQGRIKSHIRITTFPGGEIGVTLQQPITSDEVIIKAHIRNSVELMTLLMTVDAIRRQHNRVSLRLQLLYVPYARQDRVCNDGEALGISVLAQLINSCGFDDVVILDPHSDVTPALIKNSIVVESSVIFRSIKTDWSDWHIIAPDAGATKRAEKFAKAVGAAGVIQCLKKRDTVTGALSGFVCYDDIQGKNLIVLDDICDGGGTFCGLAEILNGANKLELAVTHGIFSQGVDKLVDKYDMIYTTNSFHGEVPEHLKHRKIVWKEV